MKRLLFTIFFSMAVASLFGLAEVEDGAISVSSSGGACYVAGENLTVNFSVSSTGYSSSFGSIQFSNDATPEITDDCVYANGVSGSPPDTDGHTGIQIGSQGAEPTPTPYSQVVPVPTSYNTDKYVIVNIAQDYMDFQSDPPPNVDDSDAFLINACVGASDTFTPTNTQTITQTTTQTFTQTITETPDVIYSATMTQTITQTSTETVTASQTQTVTETSTLPGTLTNTPTQTETVTQTTTQTITETPLPGAGANLYFNLEAWDSGQVSNVIHYGFRITNYSTFTAKPSDLRVVAYQYSTQAASNYTSDSSANNVSVYDAGDVSQGNLGAFDSAFSDVSASDCGVARLVTRRANVRVDISYSGADIDVPASGGYIECNADGNDFIRVNYTGWQDFDEGDDYSSTEDTDFGTTRVTRIDYKYIVLEYNDGGTWKQVCEVTDTSGTQDAATGEYPCGTDGCSAGPTNTFTVTETTTQTQTETITQTDMPTVTQTQTETVTQTNTGTITETMTQTTTETMTQSATGTVTETITQTTTPTVTLTPVFEPYNYSSVNRIFIVKNPTTVVEIFNYQGMNHGVRAWDQGTEYWYAIEYLWNVNASEVLTHLSGTGGTVIDVGTNTSNADYGSIRGW